MVALSEARDNVRHLCQDPGTTPQALSDTAINELINRAQYALAAMFPERFVVTMEAWPASTGLSQVWTPSATIGSVRRILSIGVTGVRRLKKTEINYLIQKHESVPSTAEPTRYNAYPDTTGTTENAWTVLLYGTGGGDLDVTYEFYPPALVSDTDPLRWPDAEVKWIEQIAAARAAWLNGKNQAFYQSLMDGLPEQVKTYFQVTDWLKKPRARPQEVLA